MKMNVAIVKMEGTIIKAAMTLAKEEAITVADKVRVILMAMEDLVKVNREEAKVTKVEAMATQATQVILQVATVDHPELDFHAVAIMIKTEAITVKAEVRKAIRAIQVGIEEVKVDLGDKGDMEMGLPQEHKDLRKIRIIIITVRIKEVNDS